MTPKEFQSEMERMCHLFDRPTLTVDKMEAWYTKLSHIDKTALSYVLDMLVVQFIPTRQERYPSLPTILKAVSLKAAKEKARQHDVCPHCAAGTIRFEFYDEGYDKTYERVAACSCAAGHRWASGSLHMKRYTSLFDIATAKAGFGVSINKPPADDGKGESLDEKEYERSMRGNP